MAGRGLLKNVCGGVNPLRIRLGEGLMQSRSQTTPIRGARIITVVVSALAPALSSAISARAQEKNDADAEFLNTVMPSIAARSQARISSRRRSGHGAAW